MHFDTRRILILKAYQRVYRLQNWQQLFVAVLGIVHVGLLGLDRLNGLLVSRLVLEEGFDEGGWRLVALVRVLYGVRLTIRRSSNLVMSRLSTATSS